MPLRRLISLLFACLAFLVHPGNVAYAEPSAMNRLSFQGYSGDPRKDRFEDMVFHINHIDRHRTLTLVRGGGLVEGTKWKVEKFQFKETTDYFTSKKKDASELTLRNLDTSLVIVLTLNPPKIPQ